MRALSVHSAILRARFPLTIALDAFEPDRVFATCIPGAGERIEPGRFLLVAGDAIGRLVRGNIVTE